VADVVDRVIEHPIRRKLIEALWHSSEPLSAQRFYSEYTDGSTTPATIAYHVRVLERDGILELAWEDGQESIERFVVLAGPNCSSALRRMRLA
jgi:DNA-binding transcriptional ArsR family regulator